MKKRKILCITVMLLAFCTAAFSNGTKEDAPRYLASTSWTAAFAQMGGLDDVESIAPADLVHPPEYEIVPSDITKLSNCKAFVYAGYEGMMKTLSEETVSGKMIRIKTGNDRANVRKQAELIATECGTMDKAQERIKEYEDMIEESISHIEFPIRAFVNSHQAPLAKDIGIEVVGTFGPGPVKMSDIDNAAKADFDIYIDNIHNPLSDPLVEVNEKPVLVWRNFPEKNMTLTEMVRENLETLYK